MSTGTKEKQNNTPPIKQPMQPMQLEVYDRLRLESMKRKEIFQQRIQTEKKEALATRMRPEMDRQQFEKGKKNRSQITIHSTIL